MNIQNNEKKGINQNLQIKKIKNITFNIENYLQNHGLNFTIYINNSILINSFIKDENISQFQKFVKYEINEFETNNLILKLVQDKFYIKTLFLSLEFNYNKILRRSMEIFKKSIESKISENNNNANKLENQKNIDQEYLQNYFDNFSNILEKLIDTDLQNDILYFCNKNSLINCDFLSGFCASKDMEIKIIFNTNFGIQKEIIFYQKLRANQKVKPICNIIPISLIHNSFIGLQFDIPENYKFLQCFGYNVPENIRKYLFNNCLKTNFYNRFGVLENIYYINGKVHFVNEIKPNKQNCKIIKFCEKESVESEYFQVKLTNFQSNISIEYINNLCQNFGKIEETKTKEFYNLGLKNFQVSFYNLEDAHNLINTYFNCYFLSTKLQKEYPKKFVLKEVGEVNKTTIPKILTRNIWYDYYYFYENLGVVVVQRYNKKYISNIYQVKSENKCFEKMSLKEKINYFKCVLKIPDHLIHFNLKEIRDEGILYISNKKECKIRGQFIIKNLMSINLKIVKKKENFNDLLKEYSLVI